MLFFKDSTHTYYNINGIYTSVTSLIEKYKQPFDEDFWATFKALERLIGAEEFRELRRYKDFKSPAFIEWVCNFVDQYELIDTIQIIKKEWKEEKITAADRGTHYHNVKEKQALNSGQAINPFDNKFYTTIKYPRAPGSDKQSIPSLVQLEDGYHPELILYNHQFKIAGTADKVFIETIRNIRYADIDDFKTNKIIKRTNVYQKMKSPLEKLDDCNYNHYRLQISIYAWMLEQAGFKIRNTSFTHLNEVYKISYGHTRKYIGLLLTHHYKNQQS